MFRRVRNIFSPRVPELAPREAYRLWAENYPPHAHNLLMQVEERALCELLPDVRGRPVLDLACGTGRYARILRERGARVTALDFSYEMLARSENNFARTQAALDALPLRDTCADLVVCGLAVGHVEHLEHALAEMKRVLVPHGALVYSDFHAATRKWKRTFRAENQTYAVKHYARAEQEHLRALGAVGLTVDTWRVVEVSHALAQIDSRAAAFRAQWGDTPVAFVVRAVKP